MRVLFRDAKPVKRRRMLVPSSSDHVSSVLACSIFCAAISAPETGAAVGHSNIPPSFSDYARAYYVPGYMRPSPYAAPVSVPSLDVGHPRAPTVKFGTSPRTGIVSDGAIRRDPSPGPKYNVELTSAVCQSDSLFLSCCLVWLCA